MISESHKDEKINSGVQDTVPNVVEPSVLVAQDSAEEHAQDPKKEIVEMVDTDKVQEVPKDKKEQESVLETPAPDWRIGREIMRDNMGNVISEVAVSRDGGYVEMVNRAGSSHTTDTKGILTEKEYAALQDIASRYDTTLFVVGSRANANGRNIDRADVSVGKDADGRITRSDIDILVHGQDVIDSRGRLADELKQVSGGAVSILTLPLNDKPNHAPYVRIAPQLPSQNQSLSVGPGSALKEGHENVSSEGHSKEGLKAGDTKNENSLSYEKITVNGMVNSVSAKNISSTDYINDAGARNEYRTQAETTLQTYIGGLRKEGRSEADISRIEAKLVNKLDNPITAYGVKQGLELREMRKEVDRTSSIKTVRDYYARRSQVIADGRQVKQAFGREIKGHNPEQINRNKIRLTYQQLGQEQKADLKRNVGLGHVKQEDFPSRAKKIEQVMSDARANALAQDFRQVQRQTTTQQQGGGASSGRSPTSRHRWHPKKGSCDFLTQRKSWWRCVR